MKKFLRSKTPQPPESTSNIAATAPPQSPIPPQSSSDNVAPNAAPDNREGMASQPKPIRKRDKFMALLRSTPQPPESTSNITATQPPPSPIPPQSSSDNVAPTAPNAPAIPLPPVAPQKAFVKTKVLEKDIAVLSITYIIADNPELKRLIYLIIDIHDKDEEGQLDNILEICARFSVQLGSATEAHDHRAEATECITEFIKTVEKVNAERDGLSLDALKRRTVEKVNLERDGLFLDALKRMVEDDIIKIKSSHRIFAQNIIFGTWNRLLNLKVLNPAIGASITILSIVKDASAAIPIPYVQSIIGGVFNLLTAVAQTRSNYDDMRQIAATAGEFVISCAVICSDCTTEPSKELKRALHKFTKTLKDIAKDCDELSRLNPFWRLLQNNTQKNDLQGIRAELTTAIQLFQTESQIHMQLDIEDISKKLDDATLNSLPNHPKYKRNEYLGGSRDDVLRYISGWIDKPNNPILWIHGAAGLGKSTIGQQLVHLLEEDDRLAGGVFFSNLPKEHPETVIQMISRQLGEMHPRAIADIAKAARKINGPHRPLRDYFLEYIINPIHQLKYPYQLVVVVDGVEEWSNHEAFLAELVELAPSISSSSLKFILTSRPSHSIERVLSEIQVQRYLLPPVSQQVVEHYFHHHFKAIDWRGPMPDPLTIYDLAMHAEGLLIWAATVRSLLSHKFDQRPPYEILKQILSTEEKVGARSGKQLERLYYNAISTLFPEDMHETLRNFLGAMMVLRTPLPIGDFARLLGMPIHHGEEIQQQLAVFQTGNEFESGTVPPAIQQFHFSFLEFIESTPTEYNGQSIAINTANPHLMVASRCLQMVFSEFLQSNRGKTCAYFELCPVESYAIKYWPWHLSNGTSRLLLAPFITSILTAVSDEGMRRWATLFLHCVGGKSRDEYESLDNIPRHELLYELAMIVKDDNVTTLSYQLYCLEIAVRLQPIDVKTWIAVGKAYYKLFKHDGHNKSLDESIGIFRHALQLVSRKSIGKGSLDAIDTDIIRDNEGQANTGGTDLRGADMSRLARLPGAYRVEVEAEAEALHFGDPQSLILSSLASALYARFEHWGVIGDLDEAISLHRDALAVRPTPHPDRSSSLINLGSALRTRFEQRSTPSDLDEAISLYQEGLLLMPAHHPDRSASLNNLGNALFTRFEQWGAPSDLDEAISLYQEALLLRLAPYSDHSAALNNLGNALLTRFKQRGAPSDLDEVISFHRKALLLRPAPHPLRSSSLNNLGLALFTRFEQRGAPNDLDEVISLYREAVLLRPAPHPDRSSSLNNLGLALFTRFRQQGAPSDLDEAISLYQEALHLRPIPHPDRPSSLNQLGIALLTQVEERGALSDLDEAISLYREALTLEPAPHPYCHWSLTNLANALQTRFEKLGSTSDRDEAISLRQEAEAIEAAAESATAEAGALQP